MLDNHTRSEISRGLRDAGPLLLAVAPYGMVLGAQASHIGFDPLSIGLMTGLNFAGGSEFAALRFWSDSPPFFLLVLLTFLINSRHIVMGAVLAPYMKHIPLRKAIPALFFMADEGWAVSYADTLRRSVNSKEPAFSWPYYWGACVPFYPVWVGFSCLGAALGPILGDVERFGFAMALPAVFIVLLKGMWKGFRKARPWGVSLVVSAGCSVLLPSGWYVLVGALAGIATAYYWSASE
ncbi:putative branched-chain amino acid permease (azaleucine resistance) [Pseudomonas sp. GM84]|uniref:AzlC family ABC transporter permease n=1 Tax=Pseudomonas sp. GM84 TaxID=1144340 RepID=UPI00026F4CBF|nr:AzlC family ABC transporter permease [Pseudomonas sp. GM84]EJN39637.1 putative branched-chain amino acid permease (azaleucine resistance) [Pseudomonas sp. GM84]